MFLSEIINDIVNGFEKSKHFTTFKIKALSSDTPQNIKRQNKGPKGHN